MVLYSFVRGDRLCNRSEFMSLLLKLERLKLVKILIWAGLNLEA